MATVLGKLFLAAGHGVLQVVGRNCGSVEELAGILKTGFTTDFSQVYRGADLYVAAIADDALPELAGRLDLDKKLVVHTAGSVSKDVLQSCSRNYGILYPLQSLRKEMANIPEIPFLVDGNTPDDLAVISEFASTISPMVQQAGDEQRLKIHLAAVVVSNFTNHLYTLASQYCAKEKLDFNMLMPLISSIAERIRYFEPAAVQTGPAVRHDALTIDKHVKMLNDHPELRAFYIQFTKSIEEMYRQ